MTYIKFVCPFVRHSRTANIVEESSVSYLFKTTLLLNLGHAVTQLVEVLRYKPEGRVFDSRWCHWIFH
jgi:hypothetical protein